MAMNLNLDIDFELADKITVANLKDCYERIGLEIKELEQIERKSYQEDDYEYAIMYRNAIKKVLHYFMTQVEAREYFNER